MLKRSVLSPVIALLALPLPVLQLSIALPKLSGIYSDPRAELPMALGLATAALVLLVVTLRDLRGPGQRRRLGWLLFISVAAAAMGAHIFLTNPERQSALREVVHIGEYGLLGVLTGTILRRHLGGRGAYVATLLYAGWVGLLDELVQFYHPLRVGDLRDVRVNLVSAGLGVIYLAGVRNRPFPRLPRGWEVRAIALLLGLVGSTFLWFYAETRSGNLISSPDCGTFRSRFTQAQLEDHLPHDPERYRRIQARDTARPVYAMQSLYLSETRGHILHRDGGDERTRTQEDIILRRFYRPAAEALDALGPQEPGPSGDPSYMSPYAPQLQTAIPRRLLVWFAPVPLLLGAGMALLGKR